MIVSGLRRDPAAALPGIDGSPSARDDRTKMRNLRLLLVLAPSILLPLACEDTPSSSSGGVFNPEAGPGFDGGAPATPEAGPLPDGALPDTFVPPLGVTVTVLDGVTPKKDVRVIFHDATGAVTAQLQTDAAGKVTSATAPSMVTVLSVGPDSSPEPITFLGVADGDNLRVVTPPDRFAAAGSYDVSFTPGGLIANANSLVVSAGSGCSGYGNDPNAKVTVSLYSGCLAANNSVLTTATNGGTVLGFGFAKAVLAPVGTATVAVGPLAFAAPGATTITATNVPADQAISTYADLGAIASEQPAWLSWSTGTLGAGGVVYPTPTGYADAYQTVVHMQTYSNGAGKDSALVRREATAAPAAATLPNFDLSTALPFITDVTAARPTVERPDITLTSATPAALAAADAGVVRLTWFVGALESSGSWTFVVPPSTTAFKVPALPADASAFVPSTDSFGVDGAVFFDSSQLPGYQAAKLLPIAPGTGLDVTETGRPLPAAGTLRVVRWDPNAG